MQRFQREAQVLASLNHPHIAAIHGLEHEGQVQALAMELVEGPTLAERIAQGALPVDEALPIARQIAEALEYAHEHGIIHRDLKPANIKVTPDGQVKVLDFGLAKAMTDDSAAVTSSVDFSPTLSLAATRAGLILGTAAYMAPEQAKGKSVDRRADIWAFGVVLFEMLTGKQPFSGETVSDVLAAVLTRDPDWARLPAVPHHVERLLRRCLEKNPKKRLQAIGEARILVEELLTGGGALSAILTSAPDQAMPRWRRVLPWALAAVTTLASLVVLGLYMRLSQPEPRGVARFSLKLESVEYLHGGSCCGRSIGISPDGQRIAFVATAGGTARIYVRKLGELELVALAGTESATTPFFSPDGKWLAFFAGGKLKKIFVEGGTPLVLCDVSADTRDGSWGPDDWIVFAPGGNSGLMRVPAAGGNAEPLTQLAKGDESHRWPHVLPNGKGVLYSAIRGNRFLIEVVSPKSREHRVLIQDGTQPSYAPPGYLLYAPIGEADRPAPPGLIMAAPFDLDLLQLTGSPAPVLENVLVWGGGASHYVFSRDGRLVTVNWRDNAPKRTLVWVDRAGDVRPITENKQPYANPQLTPDGRRLLFHVENSGGVGGQDIWMFDIERGTSSRLTFSGEQWDPFPSPDGRRVAYASIKGGLFSKPIDGTGDEEQLMPGVRQTSGARLVSQGTWSPDGKFVAFVQVNPPTGPDIWLLPLEGERKPRVLVQTPFVEHQPRFSPDSRWLAYASEQTGRFQVYVQAVAGSEAKWQVSTEGGNVPVWSPNGRELFYLNGQKMMVVDVQLQPTFRAGKPRVLFEGKFLAGPRILGFESSKGYDVSAGGQRFVMVQAEEQTAKPELQVTLNWFEELKARASAGKK